eukprot:scaffold302945_cov36-Prasinocladus_malaysianus.AAC.1
MAASISRAAVGPLLGQHDFPNQASARIQKASSRSCVSRTAANATNKVHVAPCWMKPVLAAVGHSAHWLHADC